MKKKSVSMLLATAMVVSLLTGCGSKNNSAADTTKEETKTEATAEAAVDESNDTTADNAGEETTITVFAAKSLNQVMEELITKFQETHPNVNVQGSYDSSGTLLTQIEEGAACDVFFSAAVKQMDQLDETDGLIVDGGVGAAARQTVKLVNIIKLRVLHILASFLFPMISAFFPRVNLPAPTFCAILTGRFSRFRGIP